MQDILHRKEKPAEKPRIPFFPNVPPPPRTLPPAPKLPVPLPPQAKSQFDSQPVELNADGKPQMPSMMHLRPGERIPMSIPATSEQIRPFDAMHGVTPPIRPLQMPIPMQLPQNPAMSVIQYSVNRPMAIEQRQETAEQSQKMSDSQRLKMLLKNKMKKE